MKCLVLLLSASVCLSACSLLPRGDQIAESGTRQPVSGDGDALINDHVRSRLVVRDFVEAMVQLPELAPASTTLYTAVPESRFGALLISTLQDAGYDLRMGAGHEHGRLEYSIVPETVSGSVDQAEYTFLISAASIKLKRRYRVDADGVRPATSMFLHGSDAGQLALNPAIFDDQRTRPQEYQSVRVAAVVPRKQAVRVRSLKAPVNRERIARRNVFETRQSNYQEVLQQFDVLRKEILVFPNDSLVMGRINKATARDIAANFDSTRDVLSLIGCSHGRSALANGNERLANGRASRVKQEFTLAGIDPELVLDEGCWASTHFDAMPARGVVVTHKRRGPET